MNDDIDAAELLQYGSRTVAQPLHGGDIGSHELLMRAS